MSTAIQVRGLSKRYRISHQSNGNAKYRTLRDTLVDALATPIRRLRNPMLGGRVEEFWALRDVSFDVQEGEVVGIIGRNGAGKSTLLKILTRITEPTEGQADLLGRVGSLLEVGTGFHPELTGRENIFLNGSILGMKRAEIRSHFDEIVEFSGVERFLDTPVKKYSSGMKVRLAFSVAAHLNPEILLIDEVLAVGDAEFQSRCLGRMRDVSALGRTVLFVSHNMAAIKGLCSRAILLRDGFVTLDDKTERVIQSYLTDNTAEQAGASSAVFDTENRHHMDTEVSLVKRVTICDQSGRPARRLPMGGTMSVCLDTKGLSKYLDARVGIMFNNMFGERIFSLNTEMIRCRYADAPRNEREVVTLTIPALRLTPSLYHVDVSVMRGNGHLLDRIERAAQFEVLVADVYGTGSRITKNFGVYYELGAWTIRNVGSDMSVASG